MLERHPEEQQLRTKLERLRRDHVELIHALFVLQHDTYRELSQRYALHFSSIERDIQRRTIENAELQRRIELFMIRKNKGHTLDEDTIRFVNDMVSREFFVYNESLRENFDRNTAEREAERAAPERKELPNDSPSNSELRSLYRSLVRRLHPDTADRVKQENRAEVFERFWSMVQEAYRNADIIRLRHIHGLLCNDQSIADVVSEDSTIETLREDVRRLEMQLDYEQRKLARIQQEEPYSLQTMLDSDTQREAHLQKLRQHLARLESGIVSATTVLRELLGEQWDLAGINTTASPHKPDFQEEFRLNTYFSMRA